MIFAVNYGGAIDVNMEEIKLRSCLSPGTKCNSNWSIDLNVKGKIFNFWKSIFEKCLSEPQLERISNKNTKTQD